MNPAPGAPNTRSTDHPADATTGWRIPLVAVVLLLATLAAYHNSFSSPQAPIIIGILGDGPVAALLARTMNNESLRGRPLVIQRYATVQEIGTCHLLFVPRSAQPHWLVIQEIVRAKHLLTLSDVDRFAQNGGAVQVSVLGNKLRLIVNVGAVREARCTVSSKLLRLAEVMGETGILNRRGTAPQIAFNKTIPVQTAVRDIF